MRTVSGLVPIAADARTRHGARLAGPELAWDIE